MVHNGGRYTLDEVSQRQETLPPLRPTWKKAATPRGTLSRRLPRHKISKSQAQKPRSLHQDSAHEGITENSVTRKALCARGFFLPVRKLSVTPGSRIWFSAKNRQVRSLLQKPKQWRKVKSADFAICRNGDFKVSIVLLFLHEGVLHQIVPHVFVYYSADNKALVWERCRDCGAADFRNHNT